MDLSESIQLIQDTAVKAAGAKGKVDLVKLPGEPDYVYGVVDANGRMERVEAAAPPRKHVLHSVDQVGDFVSRMADRLSCESTIWYSPIGVAIVLNDSPALNKEGTGYVPLKHTPQFLKLRELEKGVKLSQKEFIRLLKNHLADCMTEEIEQLLRSVRSLNFSMKSANEGRYAQGRESLGLSIEQEIASTVGPIPETVTLQVRIYTDPSLILRRPVRCAMEADASDNTLCLMPLPMELDNALQSEMEHLESMLEAGTEVPVFYGTP